MFVAKTKKLIVPDKITREVLSLERLVHEFTSTTRLDHRRDVWHRILWTQEVIFDSALCHANRVRGPLTNWIGVAQKERKKDKVMRYISALRGYFQHSDQDGALLLKPIIGTRLEIGGAPISFIDAVTRSMLGKMHLDPPRTLKVLASPQLSLPIFIYRGVSYRPPSLDLDLLAKRVLEYNQRLIQGMRSKLLPQTAITQIEGGN